MARSKSLHDTLRRDTFAGAVKLRCEDLGVTLGSLSKRIGLSENSLRARLCNGLRGKRSLQPNQVTQVANELGLDVHELHRLAAKHEGWNIDHSNLTAKPGAEGV